MAGKHTKQDKPPRAKRVVTPKPAPLAGPISGNMGAVNYGDRKRHRTR